MVLPPVEKTPVLAMRFTAETSERLIDLVVRRLQTRGLLVLQRRRRHGSSSSSSSSISSKHGDERTLLHLTATQHALEAMAEHLRLMKRTADAHQIIDYFTVADRRRFCCAPQPAPRPLQPGIRLTTTTMSPLNNLDEHGLFTSNEWSLLVCRILDDISVLDDGEISSELAQRLSDDYHADYHVHSYDDDDVGNDEFLGSALRTLATPSPRSPSLRRSMQRHGERSACLRHVLEAYQIVDAVVAVHSPQLRRDILDQTLRPWYRLVPPVVADVQGYYGWEVAFYFAWMEFLTRWLVFPGVLGVLFAGLRWYRAETIDQDELTPFYGLITFVWSVLLLRFWQRHEHRLAYQWGTYSLSPYERQKFFATRPTFRGYVRRSPVTGMIESYYPPTHRRAKYLVSAVVTVAMLVVAFAVMILSLNLQGYIHPQSNPKRWDDSNPHPFHVRYLAVLADEGRLFDANSSWRSLIPVVVHVICIFTLNSAYRVVAGALTAWENHETDLNHRNSLILKRFLFEAFDCYVALFYLAFYERDVDRLRAELMAVFQIDTLRRVLLECILPMLLQRVRSTLRDDGGVGSRHQPALLRTELSAESVSPTDDTILEDLDKDEYEQFDDYMEIVIQLGYVTLFASAYPLASLISIAANYVEIRADCFKISKVCRRPPSVRSSGLGMWRTLVASVIWTSALTNCLIAGFTSGQLTHYLPDFYIRDDAGFGLEHDDGWLVVFVIFGLERLLLGAGLLVLAVVPSVPEDVADALERQHYVRRQQRLQAAAAAVSPDAKKDQ